MIIYADEASFAGEISINVLLRKRCKHRNQSVMDFVPFGSAGFGVGTYCTGTPEADVVMFVEDDDEEEPRLLEESSLAGGRGLLSEKSRLNVSPRSRPVFIVPVETRCPPPPC